MQPSKKGTLSVHAIGPVRRLAVTGDGTDVTSQAGTHLLGRVAQQLGIADGAGAVMAYTVTRASAHDRGTLLTQVAMMIAAGGRCLSDLKTLRDQPVLRKAKAESIRNLEATIHNSESVLLELAQT